MTGDGHHVCMLGISLEETERVFPLADAASATRHPASAVRSYHLPKADGVRGGVRVKQLFILGNVPQGEKAHVLHLFRASAGDHLSGGTDMAGGRCFFVCSNYVLVQETGNRGSKITVRKV